MIDLALPRCCSDEIWVDIVGFDPFYKISSCGRVISCRSKGGVISADRIGSWKLLKLYPTPLYKGHQCLLVHIRRGDKRFSGTVHRYLYRSFKGEIEDSLVIDHVDRNSFNNHLSNLRLATQAQNQINNSNENRGVHLIKKSNKWRAKISVKGKEIWLGTFENFGDAYEARRTAELKYYGEFSNKK